MNISISGLRQEYSYQSLNETEVNPHPIEQFRTWFEQAVTAQLLEPNAMTLATSTPDGFPSARMVLLKDIDERGFIFFTNYNSFKGQELAINPHGALVFWWAELERQVRIVGNVERVSPELSDRYFYSRPEKSRLGAWASNQSQVIPSREVLEQQLAEFDRKYQGREIPRPDFWGGLRVVPQAVEFWQGRSNRLHDRILYVKSKNESWEIKRLSP
jgi:pyridoxamine 5'-phosphate oxidase